MKKIQLLAMGVLLAGQIWAQAPIFQEAIIYTTTNVIAPEEEDVQNLQSDGGRGGMNFRNMMDGETKFTTYLKNNLVKTNIKSEMGKSTIYRDNDQKTTTTLFQMMGEQRGFFSTDQDLADMQKRRDSMMQARRNQDSSMSNRPKHTEELSPETEISVTSETKKIAGYTCKKAYLITNRLLGIKDSSVVWFTPEFKLQNVTTTGGLAGMPGMRNMMPGLNGIEKIDGFVMRYETKMRRNRRMEVEVTKIELGKKIDDKEFIVPTDIEIKPIKEMQNMFGGGREGGGGFMRGRD